MKPQDGGSRKHGTRLLPESHQTTTKLHNHKSELSDIWLSGSPTTREFKKLYPDW